MTGDACSHPWLRVTCGVCGAAVDELRREPETTLNVDDADAIVTRAETVRPNGPKKLFIVARGHPELVEQLRAVLGDTGSVQVIEDRRRIPRDAGPASTGRNELRRRVLEDGSAEPGPSASAD
jgi:hypothetical protein